MRARAISVGIFHLAPAVSYGSLCSLARTCVLLKLGFEEIARVDVRELGMW